MYGETDGGGAVAQWHSADGRHESSRIWPEEAEGMTEQDA
jgi:hypothetical protein